MELLSAELENYVDRNTSDLPPLLQKILDETIANHSHSNMISGKVQGQLLRTWSKIMKPKFILEIGTFTGFSAICLAEGLVENGELHTIELRNEDAQTAQQYFDQSDVKEKIKLHIGNAIDIIPTLNYEWDLIFLDADKTGYINYYELTLPRLRTGGLILADNVLFHGQVLEKTLTGKNAKAIDEFNRHIANDKRIEHTLLSVRDGLSVIRKL